MQGKESTGLTLPLGEHLPTAVLSLTVLSLEIKLDDAAIYHLSKKSQHSVCVLYLSYFVAHFSMLRINALVPANENIL